MAYSHAMPKLETFAAFYNELMLAPSGLSKLEREMIAVVVSAENRCWYCLVAHGAAVRALSGKPELGEALALTEEAMAAARSLGNPYFIAYAYWTSGGAFANVDPAAALETPPGPV